MQSLADGQLRIEAGIARLKGQYIVVVEAHQGEAFYGGSCRHLNRRRHRGVIRGPAERHGASWSAGVARNGKRLRILDDRSLVVPRHDGGVMLSRSDG